MAAQLDDCDGLALLGCKTAQTWGLITEKLTGDLDDEQTLDTMITLAAMMTGPSWADDLLKSNYKARWVEMATSVKGRARALCELCCCDDVWLKFICQEDDEKVMKSASVLTKDVTTFAEDVPEGDTFCGKIWRWDCQGEYWEYYTFGGTPWDE